jgi:hypothetical protein
MGIQIYYGWFCKYASVTYIVQFQNGSCVMSGQIIFLAISLNFHRIVLCFSCCVVLWTYSLWIDVFLLVQQQRKNAPRQLKALNRQDFNMPFCFFYTSKFLRLYSSLGPVYEFVCVSFRTGNLNCFKVKWPWRSTWHMCQNLNPERKSWKWPRPETAVST